jgi:hypothetical protein
MFEQLVHNCCVFNTSLAQMLKQLFLAPVNCLRELVDVSNYKADVLHLLIVYEKLADTSNYKARCLCISLYLFIILSSFLFL